MDLYRAAEQGIVALRALLVANPPPGISPESIASFFARYGLALRDELAQLLEAALAGPTRRTPGTRLVWSSLREWLDSLRVLDRRGISRPSAAVYSARAAHWAALGREYIATALATELSELKQRIPKLPRSLLPTDPQRLRRERLLDWIEQRRQKLKRLAPF